MDGFAQKGYRSNRKWRDVMLDAGTPPSGFDECYTYDRHHRRIAKLILDQGNCDRTDYYYTTAWQLLEVRKGADTDPFEQYVWSLRYIDAPVLIWRDTDMQLSVLTDSCEKHAKESQVPVV